MVRMFSITEREIKHQHRTGKEQVTLLFDKLNLFITAGLMDFIQVS